MKGDDGLKIDFDLIREILLKVEESENLVHSQTFINEKYSEDLVNYHVNFLENEKFIVVKKEQYIATPKPYSQKNQ